MTQENYAAIELFKEAKNRLGVILDELADIAQERGDIIVDNQCPAATEAKARGHRGDYKRPLTEMLKERSDAVLAKDAFRLAVVGKFNAGKSTLLNALMRQEILAVDFRPKTATVTILHYSEREGYRVIYNDKSGYEHWNTDEITYVESTEKLAESIANLISDDPNKLVQKDNKSIAENIEQVDIWCSSEFLDKQELEIIDTPGLYSVFEKHGLVTEKIIPTVDAVLFLFPADPGFGEEEINFTSYIRNHLGLFLFVMTKSDQLSSSDVEKQVSFSKDVIQEIARIETEHVYPVSARLAQKGKRDKSGFSEFIEGLDKFLVSSSGLARLETPHNVAKMYHQRLNENTQFDLHQIDENVENLKAELNEMLKLQEKIEAKKETLLKVVTGTIEGMAKDAVEGIDNLPDILQKKVEQALHNFNKQALKNIEHKLPPLLQDTISDWIEEKDKRFISKAVLLHEQVQDRLKEIVEHLESFGPLHSSYGQKLAIPDLSRIAAGRSWRLGANTALKSGATFAGTFAASVAALAIFGVAWPVLIVLAPVVPIIRDAALGEERIREDVKKKLKEPLPNNSINIYKALVEGYEENGERKPGLRETLITKFNEWSNNLKADIEQFITNLVEGRLDQLRRQIEDKEGERWNREDRLQMYQKHLEALSAIQTRLEKLDQLINRMTMPL